ncbi:uncharacterized protein LOC113320912 [Papaver somniferum]|uniref:uncharacterized protein LOC113320912 n=1 Tax=Papaver somniferum TaxID=3469 RepID=UPI000E6FFCF9|nr:uncharacterized protein LOC113320912 [Papaver somniferum]
MIDKVEFNRSFDGDNTPCARLIQSFKNNNVLLQVNNSLFLYDPKNKSVRQLTICGAEEWTDAEIYVPNLVSLNSDSSREWERVKRRQPFKYGTSFVWQRPNKRQPAREYKVENFRAKLEEICQG